MELTKLNTVLMNDMVQPDQSAWRHANSKDDIGKCKVEKQSIESKAGQSLGKQVNVVGERNEKMSKSVSKSRPALIVIQSLSPQSIRFRVAALLA